MKFEHDPFPDKPKILFIGWPNSSHTHSWIDLLEGAEMNVRLFGLPTLPPDNWRVKTYLTTPCAEADITVRKQLQTQLRYRWNKLSSAISGIPRWGGEEQDLAKIIKFWRPDIIHTLGFDPASYFYLRTRKKYKLEKIGRWIAQARGGPDLYLYRFDPSLKSQMREVLHACDYFIADNQWNYDFGLAEGLSSSKLTPFGIVSGTGGMDIDGLRGRWQLLPSERERIIYMPKMYENQAVKGLSAAEGLRLAWPQIQPCRIIMTWVIQNEMKMWLYGCLGEEILRNCEIKNLVPREQSLNNMASARIVYSPSVLDGIPNTMLEAMCCGAFPIVSPLESLNGVVENEKNVLFARNLHPDELADALIRAMKDDTLVDAAAERNVKRVRDLADRNRVRTIANSFYMSVASSCENGLE